MDGGVDESGEDAGGGDRHGDVHQDLGLPGGAAAGRHCWIRGLPCAQVTDMIIHGSNYMYCTWWGVLGDVLDRSVEGCVAAKFHGTITKFEN